MIFLKKNFFVLFLLTIFPISALAATWVGPTATPPGNNISEPVNVGSVGQTKAGGLLLNTSGAASGLIIQLGNVGIGTVSPGLPLQVNRNGATTDTIWNAAYIVSTKTTNMSDGFGTGIRFRIQDDAGVENTIGEISVARDNGWDDSGTIRLIPYNAGSQVTGLYVRNTGNVGIGIAVPGAKLEVAGQVKITGGTPGAGKVLTSDATGLATWTTPAAGGVTSVAVGTGISTTGATGAITLANTGVITNSCSSGISCSGTNPSTFTNTGVTSNSAGTGISISGATGASTITNTGVTSIVAGSGISISGATGAVTVTASGGGGNVSGGGSGVANTVPKWTNATTLGNSLITDNGTNINFGTNITFTGANPVLTSGSSYIEIPRGLYVSGGTPYFQTQIQARGGIHDDQNANLTLAGGTSGNVSIPGSLYMGAGNYVYLAGSSTYRVGQASFFDTINSGVANDPLEINYNTAAPTRICASVGCATWSAYFDQSANTTLNGGLYFSQANPTISASSYFVAPGGAYFNSATVYMEAALQARGGIHNDAGANLNITGGTSGNTNFSGSILAPTVCIAGDCRSAWPSGGGGTVSGSGTTGYIPKWSAGTALTNSLIQDNGTTIDATGQFDVSGGTGTAYNTAPVEIKTTLTPRISFHWPGVVASQIGMDSSGVIRTYDNPGTSYERFAASQYNIGGTNVIDSGRSLVNITGITASGDITTYRAGSPTTGVIYLGNNSGTRYLYFDGSAYNLPGGQTNLAGLDVASVGSAFGSTQTYLYLRDSDESTGGPKAIHANSDVIGFLRGAGSWLVRWDNAGNQVSNADIYVNTIRLNGNPSVALITEGYGVRVGGDATHPLQVTDASILVGATAVGSNYGVGNVYASAFYYNSDRTLKKNIQKISGHESLDKILKLEGVSFDWKKDNTQSIGLIAQDVEKVYPELVHTDGAGLKSVEYGNLVAPLIEAVKAQQKQIDALKVEVEALKALK